MIHGMIRLAAMAGLATLCACTAFGPSDESEGVYMYLAPYQGIGINLDGHFVYLIGPADGSSGLVCNAGSYVLSGDTMRHTITHATDGGQIGRFRSTFAALSGDTVEYRILDDYGRVASRGLTVKVR